MLYVANEVYFIVLVQIRGLFVNFLPGISWLCAKKIYLVSEIIPENETCIRQSVSQLPWTDEKI